MVSRTSTSQKSSEKRLVGCVESWRVDTPALLRHCTGAFPFQRRPMTQKEQVLKHLEDYGSISPLEARHVYGIERLASRVDELRQEGHPIQTVMKKDAK